MTLAKPWYKLCILVRIQNHYIKVIYKLNFLHSVKKQLFKIHCQFSSVQSLSHVQLFAIPWIAARQASLSITNSRSSLKLMSIESVMPSSHLILCRPLFLLPPIPPSIGVFSNESTLCIRWLKYWSFSFSIIPSKEIPGLISFRMDQLDLLAVQGTLKSLLQHHSSKSINSSALSFLHSPTLTSIHDHRKNHSLDYKRGKKRTRNLCHQNDLFSESLLFLVLFATFWQESFYQYLL